MNIVNIYANDTRALVKSKRRQKISFSKNTHMRGIHGFRLSIESQVDVLGESSISARFNRRGTALSYRRKKTAADTYSRAHAVNLHARKKIQRDRQRHGGEERTPRLPSPAICAPTSLLPRAFISKLSPEIAHIFVLIRGAVATAAVRARASLFVHRDM